MRNRILTALGVAAVIGVVLFFLGIRMTKDDLHISAAAEPLFCLGGQVVGEACDKGTPITNSLVMTILVDLILVTVVVTVGQKLQQVPTGFQNVVEAIIEFFYDFARGVDAKNVGKFFNLPAAIFVFFLVGNILALVPGMGSIGICRPVHEATTAGAAAPVEGAATTGHATTPATGGAAATTTAAAEKPLLVQSFPAYCGKGNLFIPWLRAPAADLNVTFAFALVAVFMIEFWGFQALGLGYLGKFFINPFGKDGAIMTLVGIIEFISEIMRIVAFAFRIFGNIFGGEVVLAVMSFLFAYLLPLPFYGLELFVAFIQAVIFAVLTLVFSALAVQTHGGHEDEHAHDGGAKAKAAAAH